ncbi:MAG: quinolinate synthase NadA [Clostridium sp.]|nr:quinolinate synthase NadA [Clostridium sp.]MCM1399064.1 quinolinate synthase NadA [Clostridium sp.]MCM1459455.1 quinolinate synthase NadA [Bacteroides sp.]
MKIREMQDEIRRLKEEQDVCILVHAYQSHDLWEIADYIGDSFGLAEQAVHAPQKNIIMCGVRFMAETVKLLSPDKTVILPKSGAGCPMAEQFHVADIERFKAENPEYGVVAYINTTASLKTVCDVCVTSASAVKIVRAMNTDKILFIPDCNLGSWVSRQVPEKEIKVLQGGCPRHAAVTAEDVEKAKREHPKALLLVHPECKPEVTAQADYVGSTTGIMGYARESTATEFIIGTENSIVQHLQLELPDKQFYELSKDLICNDMRLTTLGDVYKCLADKAGEQIVLSDDVMKRAKPCIDEMLRLG